MDGLIEMIEEEATVVALDGAAIWVETQRRSGCSQCASASGCAPSLLGALLGNGRTRLRLSDSQLGLQPGERVVIGLPGHALVRAALLAYLLPLLTLVIAAQLAELWTWHEGLVVLAALLGLGGGLGLAAWLARLFEQRHPEHRPRLLRRASDSTHCAIPAIPQP